MTYLCVVDVVVISWELLAGRARVLAVRVRVLKAVIQVEDMQPYSTKGSLIMLRVTSLFLVGVCWLGCTTASAAEQAGLAGYWKFDTGQGDVAVDSSGNANDGDIWGAQWVRGRFGTALRFDGQGAHVAIPQLAGLDGSDHLSVEAWVYWEGGGRYPNILTGGTWSPGGFLLFVRDDQCSFRMGRPGASAVNEPDQWREVSAPLLTPFVAGRWYHIAATFARPIIKTYVNGREVAAAKWDYPLGYSGDLVIGKWSGTVGHKGLIDEVSSLSTNTCSGRNPDELPPGNAAPNDGANGRTRI